MQTLIYLAMGWLVVVAVKPLFAHVPRPGLLWLLFGGLCYTLGTVFYLWKKLPYHHAVWHLFVLGGSVCHYFAILFYVLHTWEPRVRRTAYGNREPKMIRC